MIDGIPKNRNNLELEGFVNRNIKHPPYELWANILKDSMKFALVDKDTGFTQEYSVIEDSETVVEWSEEHGKFVPKKSTMSTLLALLFKTI